MAMRPHHAQDGSAWNRPRSPAYVKDIDGTARAIVMTGNPVRGRSFQARPYKQHILFSAPVRCGGVSPEGGLVTLCGDMWL